MKLFALVLLLALVATVSAGGYGNNTRPDRSTYPKKKYTGYTYFPATTANLAVEDLPQTWSWCDVNGENFCTSSWQQHIPKYCGACWVHGTLSGVQDRIKIANRGKHNPDILLARQVMLNCGAARGGFGNGCDGGEAFDVLEYMHRFGLPDDTCNNYAAQSTPTCDTEAMCMNCMFLANDKAPHCWAIPEKHTVKYYVKSYGFVSGEQQIMNEIIQNGPVTCGMTTPDEFCFGYHGGVWIDEKGGDEVDHDVEVVGWGVDETGMKYWTVRNSWGTYWGENGFFRLQRGVNSMHIEDNCAAAIVDTHELDAVLSGKVTGSMFGVISPDEPPKYWPKGWDQMEHQWKKGDAKAGEEAENVVYKDLQREWKHEQERKAAFAGRVGAVSAASSASSLSLESAPDSGFGVMTGVLIGVGLACAGFVAYDRVIKPRMQGYESL